MVAYILIRVRLRHLPLRLSVQEPTIRFLGIHFCIIFVTPVPYICYVPYCVLTILRYLRALFCLLIFVSLFFFIFCSSFTVLLFVLSFSFPLSFIFALDGMFVLGYDCGLYSNSGINQASSPQAVRTGTNRTFFGYSLLYYLCYTCSPYLLRPILCSHHFTVFACAFFSPYFFFLYSHSFIAPLFLYYCLFSLSHSLSLLFLRWMIRLY